jgi:zinc protease
MVNRFKRMINRSISPELNEIESVSILKPLVFDVSKHVKLFWIKEVYNDTARLELHFDAGTRTGSFGIPAIVHNLLFSGTEFFNSTQIHDQIDSFGAFLDTSITDESASISIYSLKDQLLDASKVVENAISGLCFREDEVNDVLIQMKSSLKTNLEKVSMLCQRKVKTVLFEQLKSYNTIGELEHYEQADIKSYKLHLQSYYFKGLKNITIVGNLPQDTIDSIIDLFGKWSKEEQVEYPSEFIASPSVHHIEKKDALQTAIRIVKPLYNKLHPEYTKMQVLITVLGDYFGSRLMTNIREDKGYTYGIGAYNPEMIRTGYFVISTEVGKDVKDATITEIRKEIELLQKELIPVDELELVKNYMLGQTLKGANGPYAMLDLYLSVYLRGLDVSFYDQSIKELKNITPQDLLELAKRELKWEDFIIVTAG